MRPEALDFNILHCLTTDDFTNLLEEQYSHSDGKHAVVYISETNTNINNSVKKNNTFLQQCFFSITCRADSPTNQKKIAKEVYLTEKSYGGKNFV